MSRPRTIDQTPTDKFDRVDTKRLPRVKQSVKRRSSSWGEVLHREMGRRGFQGYVLALMMISAGIVVVMMVMHQSPLPQMTASSPSSDAPRHSHAPARAPRTYGETPLSPISRPLVPPHRPHRAHPSQTPAHTSPASPRPSQSRTGSPSPRHHRPSPSKTASYPGSPTPTASKTTQSADPTPSHSSSHSAGPSLTPRSPTPHSEDPVSPTGTPSNG